MTEIDDEWLPTEKMVQDFHLHTKMLKSLGTEIRELSKKKQEGVLNLIKVKMINRVLEPLHNEILAHVPARIFLDLLDEDSLPNNSDAVLVISQYETAIIEFTTMYQRSFKIDPFNTHHYWATVEDPDGTADFEDEEEYDDDETDDSMESENDGA